MKTLVIIPCYNEEESVINFINDLKEKASFAHYIIINDSSTDKTLDLLKEHNLNYINNPINLGIGGGVQAGYIYAKENNYDIAVQMDGDGQHLPEYLKAVCQPIIDGEANMSIGSRFIDKKGFQTSFLRRLGINIISSLIFVLTQKKVRDVTSGFRACDKELIDFFSNNYADDYPEPEAIMECLMNNYTIKEVSVQMQERQGGVSSIRSIKSVYYMVKVCLSLFIHRISFTKRR